MQSDLAFQGTNVFVTSLIYVVCLSKEVNGLLLACAEVMSIRKQSINKGKPRTWEFGSCTSTAADTR